MPENPKCLIKTPEANCPQNCPQYFQAEDFQEIDLISKLAESNKLRRLDKVNIKPQNLASSIKREDYVKFFSCRPEDCLLYRQQVLKIQ